MNPQVWSRGLNTVAGALITSGKVPQCATMKLTQPDCSASTAEVPKPAWALRASSKQLHLSHSHSSHAFTSRTQLLVDECEKNISQACAGGTAHAMYAVCIVTMANPEGVRISPQPAGGRVHALCCKNKYNDR